MACLGDKASPIKGERVNLHQRVIGRYVGTKMWRLLMPGWQMLVLTEGNQFRTYYVVRIFLETMKRFLFLYYCYWRDGWTVSDIIYAVYERMTQKLTPNSRPRQNSLEIIWSCYILNNSSSFCFSFSLMAPHSSTLAWKIPWMDEPGELQSMGSLRVRHNWATSLSLLTFRRWRRKWQPTPVFLPGESQGRGSLVGCRLWGHTESDTTEVT